MSQGCANCYAETLSGRNPGTLGVWGPNGTRVVASESMWREPLKWDRAAAKAGERHRVFCASLADVFEDWPGPMANSREERLTVGPHGEWLGVSKEAQSLLAAGKLRQTESRWLTMNDVRARLFKLIYATPNLDWLLLTKRPENAARMMGPDGVGLYAHADGPVPCPQPNVWIGTSVENQAADERHRHLMATSAAVRFWSAEPLLGGIDALSLWDRHGKPDWVIIGGESGHGARPMQIEWVRSLVEQCRAAGVACFVKQLGASVEASDAIDPIDQFPGDVKFRQGRDIHTALITLIDRKGGDMNEWPDDLRVREFPK